MSKCWACGLPVYFAERRTSLGKDWHRQCLRCVHCKKVLQPGQHAEHNGLPYCEKPCYNVLFGPRIHGFRVIDHILHNKFGNPSEWKSPIATLQRSDLISKIRTYNQRQLACNRLEYSELNGRILISGFLRIQWRVCEKLHLIDDGNGNQSQRNAHTLLPSTVSGSAFVPAGSITSVHATNEETVETVIGNLFRKFSIRNNPSDFVLAIAFPKRMMPTQELENPQNPTLLTQVETVGPKRLDSKRHEANCKQESEEKKNGKNDSAPSLRVVDSADGEISWRILENESPLVAIFEFLLECPDDRQREEVTICIADYFELADFILSRSIQSESQPNVVTTTSAVVKPRFLIGSESASKQKQKQVESSRKLCIISNPSLDNLPLDTLERVLRCVDEQEQREFMRIRNKFKQIRMQMEFAMNKSEILL